MKKLTRRAFLGGAGALVALPFLESLAPKLAHAQMDPARRLLVFYVPNGIHMPAWTPTGTGTNWELTRILQPLAGLESKLNVITGLANEPAHPDGPGDHAAGTAAFLTAVHVNKTEGSDILNGPSMDQVAAAAQAEFTRFPSLQLGIDGGGSVGNCDSGYSCAYARNISWAGPQTPLPKTVNPKVVFDRLFAGFDSQITEAERARRKAYERSVLDTVLEDANALHGKLGTGDRHKVDEYLTGIRELEVRLESSQDGPTCNVPSRPPRRLAYQDHVKVMSDLMVLALQCDLTHVITFMLGNAASTRAYPFLGVSGAHHEISHHQNKEENFEALTVIDTWEIEQLGYLLRAMDAVQDGPQSTLLDNSLVMFSSEIEDGNRHGHTNLPVLLAGGQGGRVPTGRHLVYENQEPIADLFISIMDTMDARVDTFGDDGTGKLAGFLA